VNTGREREPLISAGLPTQLVDVDPDATVVIFGANDAQDFKYKGRVVRLGSPSWRRAYQDRVGEAMEILTRNSRRV